MKIKINVFVLFLCSLLNAEWNDVPEKNLIQGIATSRDGMRLESIYQIGSQAYIQVEFYQDLEPKVYPGEGRLFSEELVLPIPSFVVLLTEESAPAGAKILYADGEWKGLYRIDPENPLIFSYDSEGEWDVTNYPWVYNQKFGYIWVHSISEVTLVERSLALSISGSPMEYSRYSRWIYTPGFGWSHKFNYFIPFPGVEDVYWGGSN